VPGVGEYVWAYGPDKPLGDALDVQYPPHAERGLLPASDCQDLGEIFNPRILFSVKEVLRNSPRLYFRLPHEKQLAGGWTLKEAAEANKRIYDQCKAELGADACADPLNPLLKNNIGKLP
jgi:hypothetical protein